MADNFTRQQFIEHCAANRKLTVPQFHDWLRENRLAVYPCDCGDGFGHGACRGWKVEPRGRGDEENGVDVPMQPE